MNNFQDCYSYDDIRYINNKLDLNLNDQDTRILQHRLFNFNKLMNVVLVEVYEKNILGSGKPFLRNLNKQIYDTTRISLSNKEIAGLIEQVIQNKDGCKKLLESHTEQYGGSFGWVLPSENTTGKGVDVFSLILDLIGLFPGWKGNLSDIINVIVNVSRQRYFDAGMSFIGLFSYIGLLAPAAKLGWRYFQSRREASEEGEGEGEEGEEVEDE